MKPKLYINVNKAGHFLSWELPYFERHFELVDQPSKDAILFSFGPDALASGARLPARLRVILLFPGFSYHPYHDEVHRLGMQQILESSYDLVFANPGPIAETFRHLRHLRLCPFSINTNLIKLVKPRTRIDSLLHASANYPQKDWTRSRDIMAMTGLKYEVFPPRHLTLSQRLINRARRLWGRFKPSKVSELAKYGYEDHSKLIAKYHQHDGFVHIAAEIPPYVDGKYTATLLEAGLSGCILFWHDTLGLGNDFETIFDLPLDPPKAAEEILHIRKSINVEYHSRRTSEEIYERCRPDKVVEYRWKVIEELLT